jgi:hypothetical protein
MKLLLIVELTQLWLHLDDYGPGFLFEQCVLQQLVMHMHASSDGTGQQ